MSDSDWLLSLESVNSEQEGQALLFEHAAELSDATTQALQDRANTLQHTGDPDGAAEFQAWAQHARAIMTRRDLLASDVQGIDDGIARMRAVRERFDQAFVNLCEQVACMPFGALESFIQASNRAGAEEIIAKVRDRVEFDLGFLRAVAIISGNLGYQGHYDFADGCWRQLLFAAESLSPPTPQAENLRQQAQDRLQACTENIDAPTELRAKAENNLATLAYPDLDQVKKHQNAALTLAESSGERLLARDMRRHLAFWARQAADWESVFTLLNANLKAAEKAVLDEYSPQLAFRIVSNARVDVSGLLDACLELGKRDPVYWERAIEIVEWGKSRPFLRAAMVVATHYREIPLRLQQRRDRIDALMRRLGQQLPLLPAAAAERIKGQLDDLLTLTGEVVAQIEKFGSRRLFDTACFPCSYADMVKTVPAGAVALCFFQQKERVVTFILGPEGLRGKPAEIAVTSEQIVRAMVQFEMTSAIRAQFDGWNQIQISIDEQIEAIYPTDSMKWLYHVLVAPLQDRIEGSNVVYVSADSALLKLPLHACLKDDNAALIDDVPVAYTPGIAVLRRALAAESSPVEQAVFAAGVAKDKGGPACSEAEAAAVAQFFGTKPEPATCAAVASRGARSSVLHLSCHTNNSNALTSAQGLQLEDGLFGVDEILGGKFQARLVFLSACETSRSDVLGYGEELIGIVGAFMRCGVSSVIATMWKMPEVVSVPLVQAYYSELVNNGANRAVALQRAIQSIKRQERFNHPYFWAPICLYGLP